MQGKPRPFVAPAWLAIGLAPILAGGLFWGSYSWGSYYWRSHRHQAPTATPSKAVAGASLPAPLESAATDVPANKGTSDETTAPIDPDPFAGSHRLAALPHDAVRGAPRVDPGRLRTIVDRGVVAYASAKTDADRAKGASLIQTAALVGFPSARVLLARNYPQSEAIRSVVPANDVIRYALAFLLEPALESDDSKQIFLALGQHFALHGEVDLFATQILNSLRGDSRPQLSHRVDLLLNLLERIPGSCTALARLMAGSHDASNQECSSSFSEKLRRHIETTTPASEEEESKGRGLFMLNQLGSH
jgi:hypothetical protein